MANKKPTSKKRAPSANADATKVTRIKASDSKPKSSVPTKKPEAATKPTKAAKDPESKNWFSRLLGYFSGSWYELRQVLWPDRKSSWSMTLALIIFTLIFIAIILLLDALFQYLFSLALGK